MLLTCALVLAVVAAARGTWSPCGLSMVSSINPFSEAARGHRYAVTCAWFVLGALLGGLALGTAAALLAVACQGLPASVALLAAAVTVASDLRVGGVRLPVHPRQVDEAWLRTYRPWVYGVGFGAQIGAGFATYVMTAATYLVVVLAALSGSPVGALATGAVFGVVRGSAVLLGATARTPEQLRALHRRLDELAPASLAAAVVAQVAVATAIAWHVAGPVGLLVGLGALAVVPRRQAGVLVR